MKRKFLFGLLTAIAVIAFVSAAIYVEPWNTDVDAGNHSITNVYNLSAEIIEGEVTGNVIGDVTGNLFGNVSGNMAWSNLTDYPSACPGASAITTLGDSVPEQTEGIKWLCSPVGCERIK